MKMHLKSSDTPITFGAVTADCGELVGEAVPAFMWDYELLRSGIDMPLSTCRRCLKTCKYECNRYVYGIVNGEESKHAEAA
jgi:hypothetical protein